ncbi:MAG: MarR family winged helix-turn-helix transcriptional regulator [Acidimicrobiia bacterium]
MPTRPSGEDSVVSMIVRTSRMLSEQMRRTRSELSPPLSTVHTVALSFVYSHEGATITDLGRHLNVTKQSAWEVVSGLEEQGILRRVPHRTDGRARELVLTDAGQARIEDGRRRWAVLEREWVAIVGEDNAEMVRHVLQAYLDATDAARIDELARASDQ